MEKFFLQAGIDVLTGVQAAQTVAAILATLETGGGSDALDVIAIGAENGVKDAAKAEIDKLAAEEGAAEVVTKNSLVNQAQLDELASSGVKYDSKNVIMTAKDTNGNLYWLEKGNSNAGFQHIMEGHETDFSNKGINPSDVPDILQDTLEYNTPLNTGSSAKGLYSDYMINGSKFRVAYGTNGFIVSFYPIP